MFLRIFRYRVLPEMRDRHLSIQSRAARLYEKHVAHRAQYFRLAGDPNQWVELHWYADSAECARVAEAVGRDPELAGLWREFQQTLDRGFPTTLDEFGSYDLPAPVTMPPYAQPPADAPIIARPAAAAPVSPVAEPARAEAPPAAPAVEPPRTSAPPAAPAVEPTSAAAPAAPSVPDAAPTRAAVSENGPLSEARELTSTPLTPPPVNGPPADLDADDVLEVVDDEPEAEPQVTPPNPPSPRYYF